MPRRRCESFNHVAEVAAADTAKSKQFKCNYCAAVFSATSSTRIKQHFLPDPGSSDVVACLSPPRDLVTNLRKMSAEKKAASGPSFASAAASSSIAASTREAHNAQPVAKRLFQPKITDMARQGEVNDAQAAIARFFFLRRFADAKG